jgi:hypothetical protein
MTRFMFVTGYIAFIMLMAKLFEVELFQAFAVVALVYAIDNRYLISAHHGVIKALLSESILNKKEGE